MEPRIHLPQSLAGLRSWLMTSKEGRALLPELRELAFEEISEAKCRACENIRPFPKALVVLRRLGRFPGAEVYAEEGVSVRFLEMPDVSSDGEIGKRLEEFIEASLPRNWRHLVGLPAKRIKSDVFRGVSLSDTLCHKLTAEALKEIRDIGRPTEQP